MLRIVLAVMLISVSLQNVADICQPLTVSNQPAKLPAGQENLKTLALTKTKKDEIPRDGMNPFENIYLIEYGQKKAFHLLKVGKIRGGPFKLSASSAAIQTNFQIKGGGEEGDLVYCQYDGNQVFVLKTVTTLADVCEKLNPEPQGTGSKAPVFEMANDVLKGDVAAIPRVFDSMELLGKGSFGTVRKLILKDGSAIAVKSGSMAELSVTEVKVLKGFNDKTYGTGFKGCYLDLQKQTVYIAQEIMSTSMGNKDYLQKHRAKKKSERVDIYIQIGMGMIALQKFGYNHNDLKPTNIMADSKGRAHLVDFGFARKLGSYDNYGGSAIFCPPVRLDKVAVRPEYETFSLAVTFLAMESPDGEGLMAKDPDTGEEIDSKLVIPSSIDEEKFDIYRRVMRKVLIPVWGKIDEEEFELTKMNFQSLIWNIITTPSLPTVQDFVNQLNVIKAALIAKKERALI